VDIDLKKNCAATYGAFLGSGSLYLSYEYRRMPEYEHAMMPFTMRSMPVDRHAPLVIILLYLTQCIEAIAVEPAHARHLGGEVGTPLLQEIDTMILTSGAACGLFISYCRNDLFSLVSSIRLQVPSK
jgi:hypothetical protein